MKVFLSLLFVLSVGYAACVSSDTTYSGTNIYRKVCTTEVVCNTASTTCSITQNTATPYNALRSARSWSEIFWQAEVHLKTNSGNFTSTVTVPKAGLKENNAYGQDASASCVAGTQYTKCVGEQYPVISPQSTITVTFSKPSGVPATGKLVLTGTNTDVKFVYNVTYSKNYQGKDYFFEGWPDWDNARATCHAMNTGVKMCLGSIHSEAENDMAVGLLRTHGYVAAWNGQCDGVQVGKYNEGWQWSDGSHLTYTEPWNMMGNEGSEYSGRPMKKLVRSDVARSTAIRALTYAGNDQITNGHICGFSLSEKKQWSSMRCNARLPGICRPCMYNGDRIIQPASVCDECVFQGGEKCYSKQFCDKEREKYVFPTKEDVVDYGKIVATVVPILIALCCCSACWYYKSHRYEAESDKNVDED